MSHARMLSELQEIERKCGRISPDDSAGGLIHAMHEAGLDIVFGCDIFEAPEVFRFFRDPVAFIARIEGVTKSDFLRFIANDGIPRCGGRTVSGRRCRNIIPGGYPGSPKEFLALDGEYCHIHDPR